MIEMVTRKPPRLARAMAGIVVGTLILSVSTATGGELPDHCWGVYSWAGWKPDKVTPDLCPHVVGVPIILHWDSIEPRDGEYLFEQLLGDRLRLADRYGYYSFVMPFPREYSARRASGTWIGI